MTAWQIIFRQSKVNGCPYYGEELTPQTWDWPKGTWFEERLSHVRKRMRLSSGPCNHFDSPIERTASFPHVRASNGTWSSQ
jgi:hypothetical protein